MTVLAADTNNGFDAELYAEEELNTWSKENGIGVKFENFRITPTNDAISDAEIEASTRSYVEMASCRPPSRPGSVRKSSKS